MWESPLSESVVVSAPIVTPEALFSCIVFAVSVMFVGAELGNTVIVKTPVLSERLPSDTV